MAHVYPDASISPTKLELLEAWVPTQPWGAAGVSVVGAYRFDDPAGEVGIETFLLDSPGGLLQVPLTFRGAPLDDVEPITAMSHTVLGDRWVYDGLTDRVAVTAFVTAALTGGVQADVGYDDPDGNRHVREPQVLVAGSGSPGSVVPALGPLVVVFDDRTTSVTSGSVELLVARVVPLSPATGGTTLTATWPGQDTPALLASVLTG